MKSEVGFFVIPFGIALLFCGNFLLADGMFGEKIVWTLILLGIFLDFIGLFLIFFYINSHNTEKTTEANNGN